MTTVSQTTKKHRIFSARQMKESFDESSRDTYYFFIGQTTAPTPPLLSVPVSTEERMRIWENMIELKRISASDVQFVYPRNDWVTDTIYKAYSNKITDIHTYGSYVLTDQNRVYMCLSNNEGTASNTQPTGESTSLEITPDGYHWKFLYEIDPLSSTKFVDIDSEWVPALVDARIRAASEAGAIYQVNILDRGNYQSDASPYTLNIQSSVGSGLDVEASLQYYGQIKSLTITNPGWFAEDGTFPLFADSVAGANLDADVVISGGNVVSVSISNVGRLYEQTDTIYVDTSSMIGTVHTNATFSSSVLEYGVANVNILSTGTDYQDVSLSLTHPDVTTNAVFEGVITPLRGLGYNPVEDLDAHYLMYSAKMSKYHDTANSFVGAGSYYFMGIIANPVESNTSLVATSDKYLQVHRLSIAGKSVSGTISVGQTITQSITGATGNILYYDATAEMIFVNGVVGDFDATINYSLSTATSTIEGLSEVLKPDLVAGSGDILYTQLTDDPIVRSPSQGENYQVVIEY